MLEFDRNFFPEPRTAFLKAWVSQPGTISLGASKGSKLSAYGVLRPCRVGFKIGPLFADSSELAEAIFAGLRQHVPVGAPCYLDVPACNPQALALAARHGMKPAFETARMYLGPAPDLSLERTYGITSFELG
ncbi:MAG: hypothetical protein Q8K23_13360 [Sulfuritalea sp.]|nr:hypothetical protein [Sulfuritalea sp.]